MQVSIGKFVLSSIVAEMSIRFEYIDMHVLKVEYGIEDETYGKYDQENLLNSYMSISLSFKNSCELIPEEQYKPRCQVFDV